MQLSPISLAITRLGGVRFSPSALFSSGEQGAWYDPSDLTTLFQDSAGTTPVTAVEQPVGLVLDKRGPTISYNPATMAIASYDGGGASTIVRNGANLTFTSAASGDGIRFNAFTAADNYSVIEFVASGSGTLLVYAGGTPLSVTLTASPTAYRAATQPNTASFTIFRSNSAGLSASITINAVYAIRGNHAYQTTSASRPTLRARYNLLTRSEEFNDGVWNTVGINAFGSGSVVNTTATLDPLGGNTAEFIQENNVASTTHGLNTAVTLIANAVYTITCYFKAATRTFAIIGIDSAGGNGARAFFNLSTGSLGTTSALGTGTLVSATTPVDAGNGWYRCQLTAKVDPAATSATLRLSIAEANGAATYSGNGTSGIFIWGAQLTQTAVFPSNTYQRIAAATDYATGAAFPPYLFFDGVDDSLLTNSVDFSATDKMTVWAGVTKSSDAATGTVVDLNGVTGTGAFMLRAPSGAVANYVWFSGGTTALGGSAISPSNYSAPITNVVTGIANISGPTTTLRVNAVQVATDAASQGTGNYSNLPIYIGRRQGTALPLNGNIYSLIIRGAQSTAAQISSTESWVAAKTPLGTL